MANNSKLNFWSGLLQGYTQTSEKRKEREIQENQRKLQTKLFENQLEQMELEKNAKGKIGEMMTPYMPTGEESLGSTEGRELGKGQSLLDVLADPKGELLLMQSGVKPETIVNMKALSQLSGGAKIPEGMILEGVKYDTKGRPMYDYGIDPLNKPASLSALSEYVDANGRPAPPGMTPRQLQEGGYTPKGQNIDPTAAARITSMDIAIQSAGDVIGRIAPGGKVDKTLLFQMNAPMGGVGEGRDLYLMMRDAIGSKVYAETGVTARPDELNSVLDRFLPKPQDLTNEGLAVKKLERFQDFMQRTLDTATLPESVRNKLQSTKPKADELKAGHVEDGYKFLGGNPSDPSNWEKQ
jgi:hypothetical protein